jgi:thiamine-phosphate pyrophosphorylase
VIYVITDRRALPEASWPSQLELLAAAARLGATHIQIREKDLSAQQLAEYTRQAIAVARPHGTRILVNDRADVALAVGADGVHLRVTSLSAGEVRAFAPPDFLIGVSTHSLAEAQAAQNGGANFITCGPVYETPSKREYGAPLGLQTLSAIAQAITLPTYALGGITKANLHEPLQNGAAGIAAISLFQNAEQLADTIAAIHLAKRG